MSQSRTTLPEPVLVAIEECITAAMHHGKCVPESDLLPELQKKRRLLVIAIEDANKMYEGGIEMGRAQERGPAR